MTIARLQITIEPWNIREAMKELRVEVIVDGMRYTSTKPLRNCDFESNFDYLMEQSRLEILRLVKAYEKKRSDAEIEANA